MATVKLVTLNTSLLGPLSFPKWPQPAVNPGALVVKAKLCRIRSCTVASIAGNRLYTAGHKEYMRLQDCIMVHVCVHYIPLRAKQMMLMTGDDDT